jgi:hypothetical protein
MRPGAILINTARRLDDNADGAAGMQHASFLPDNLPQRDHLRSDRKDQMLVKVNSIGHR